MSVVSRENSACPPAPDAGPGTVRRSRTRWWATGILGFGVVVVGVAASLPPDARGHGTHTGLGSGPCGFLVMTGYPCPTCGMTTAFAHTVRGQWWHAARAQPAGFALALATLAGVLLSIFALAAGRWPAVPWLAARPFWLFLGLLVVLLGGWAFKVVAGLLDHSLPYR